MDAKQTAVSIIIENFNLLSDNDFKTWFLNSMDKFEAMEKEQMKYAYDSGFISCHEIAHSGIFVQENDLTGQAEQYYNETYGGNK